MAKIHLSDVGLRSLPPPAKGQRSYWDAKLPTFGVRVSQGGTKTFVLNRGNSLITIGRFPVLSLSEARAEAKRRLAEFTLGKTHPQSVSYAKAVEHFIADKQKNRRASTVKEYNRLLHQVRFTEPVANITHSEVARRLTLVKGRSAHDHLLVALRVFFNWTMKRRLRADNPTMGLSTYEKQPRARVLSDDELKAVWNTAEQMDGHFGTIARLLMLTGMRRNECASLRSDYIDLDNKTICLPASLTKNKREHKFPIGHLTVSILVPLPNPPGLLFPARGNSATPFNGWSTSKTLLDRLSGVTAWTLHDLRRTYATNLAKLGVPIHIIERLLNHVSGTISGIAAVYNRARYMDEMRAAIVALEQRLTAILQDPSI
jgi:integrase